MRVATATHPRLGQHHQAPRAWCPCSEHRPLRAVHSAQPRLHLAALAAASAARSEAAPVAQGCFNVEVLKTSLNVGIYDLTLACLAPRLLQALQMTPLPSPTISAWKEALTLADKLRLINRPNLPWL